VRALVVAAATMAILLVCFSIYQHSLLDPAAGSRVAGPRLPSPAAQPAGFEEAASGEESGSISIGQGRIGAGERAHISVYNPDGGREARLEIDVLDWTPVAGSSNEFLLSEPDIRMRTNDGHPVRITAARGVMAAERKGDSGVDPKRGRLSGGVVIEYDRLSEAERTALPEDQRGRTEPTDIIRIETGELEFDLEYSKLLVPGRLILSAQDIRLEAADLELRFNEVANRVEYLRIGGDGSIVLLQPAEKLGLAVPGMDAGMGREKLADWLRNTLARQLQAGTGTPAATEPGDDKLSSADDSFAADGTPIFRPDREVAEKDSSPARYYARFEGDVEVRRSEGGTAESRLVANVLEIVRELTAADREPAASPPAKAGGQAEGASPSDDLRDEIRVTWAQRLVIEACQARIEACAVESLSYVSAEGSPVRLVHPEGSAEARRLSFSPASSQVELIGDEQTPASVRGMADGTLTALAISSERNGDAITIRAVGPGTFDRGAHPDNEVRPGAGEETAEAKDKPSRVDFADGMHAIGRVVRERGLDRTGAIYSRERRMLDRANFTGAVAMTHEETRLSGDEVNIDFGTRRRDFFKHEQIIEGLSANGHVVMSRDEDRLSCRELQIGLRMADDGSTVPRLATALGDIVAQQGDLAIRARDRLVVTFGPVVRPEPIEPDANLPDPVSAKVTTAAELDTASGEEALPESSIGATRLEAYGAVTVNDPAQGLEVAAESLDCAIHGGREIGEAFVEGLPDRPASVRLDTFTITGDQIRLNAMEESAEVPGPGRLTFQSHKDLDGRKLAEPIPVSITWDKGMSYDGRESRARFVGSVHAVSQNTTTFDCRQLDVHFDEVDPEDSAPSSEGWILRSLVNRFSRLAGGEKDRTRRRLGKEPAYLVATGDAVAVTSETDPQSGALHSRVRISGPKLWVNLRSEVSKLMIEGAGNLLLEDYEVASASSPGAEREGGGLFSAGTGRGPSTTLIEWRDLMWYDFSIEQTRFEGEVSLKHFSGEQLERVLGRSQADSTGAEPGRATFLSGDILTVDFRSSEQGTGRIEPRRMGRLSAGRLDRFQASGAVRLQDVHEELSLTADRVVFWKDRNVLAIYGSPQRKAHIIKQRAGQLPHQVSVERLFYNLTTGAWEIYQSSITSR
jgi:hypothetical protein